MWSSNELKSDLLHNGKEEGEEEKISLRGRLSHMTKDKFLLFLLFGILLLVIAWPVEKKESYGGMKETEIKESKKEIAQQSDLEENQESDLCRMRYYTKDLEQTLEEVLCTVDGVGRVKVMITVEDNGKAIVEKDHNKTRSGSTEVDSAGGSRNTTDITDTEESIYADKQGAGKMPYVTQMLMPKIAGVLVSAQGGGNAVVAQNITDAIQALFGIPAHKIKIVKMIS